MCRRSAKSPEQRVDLAVEKYEQIVEASAGADAYLRLRRSVSNLVSLAFVIHRRPFDTHASVMKNIAACSGHVG